MKKIILASGSPRRFELMKLLGVPFEVMASEYDEDSLVESDPIRYVETLSLEKAKVVAEKHQDAIVIGSDTTVTIDGKILAKPRDIEDAKRMLKLLSGTEHEIITAFTIIDTKTNNSVTKSVTSRVKMKDLTESEIDAYIATGEPMDRAGAYAVQEKGGIFVEEIHGDVFNIIGLPLKDLRRELKEFGVNILE